MADDRVEIAGGTDGPLAHWWYARYRERLLELGVEVHELIPTLAATAPRRGGSSASSTARRHGKLAVADRRRVLIGSMNIDNRSARRSACVARPVAATCSG